MIRDENVRGILVDEWHTLRRSLGRLAVHYTASFARGGWMMSAVVDNIYALYLPFGFSVLEHALQQIRDQGTFSSKSSQLGKLMAASKASIPWRDFDFIDGARDIRNKLTHEQAVPVCEQTFHILDKIEQELIGWAILEGPVRYQFTLSIKPTG